MLSRSTLIAQTRWQVAALRVQFARLRLQLALRAYNPAQPRVPSGNPDGGRWTTGDGRIADPMGDDARFIFVGDQDNRRYRVALEEEEARGGHTLRKHLGKTDDEMLQRVQRSAWRTLTDRGGMRRDGSFSSLESANDLVNQTLHNNQKIVDRVVNGELDDAFIKSVFESKTGREAYSTDDGVSYLRDTFGVGVFIKRDSRSPRGYRVHTAYPRTEGD